MISPFGFETLVGWFGTGEGADCRETGWSDLEKETVSRTTRSLDSPNESLRRWLLDGLAGISSREALWLLEGRVWFEFDESSLVERLFELESREEREAADGLLSSLTLWSEITSLLIGSSLRVGLSLLFDAGRTFSSFIPCVCCVWFSDVLPSLFFLLSLLNKNKNNV